MHTWRLYVRYYYVVRENLKDRLEALKINSPADNILLPIQV